MANYYIGLMSGTSMDGVDGVVLDKDCRKIIASLCVPYPDELKKNLLKLTQNLATSLKNTFKQSVHTDKLFITKAVDILCKSDTVH